eukprot:2864938-Alexandrium_andersonii.AAC.1
MRSHRRRAPSLPVPFLGRWAPERGPDDEAWQASGGQGEAHAPRAGAQARRTGGDIGDKGNAGAGGGRRS